jgi:hypothetical protein
VKLKSKILLGTVALALLPFAAGNLAAQVTNTLTITSTASVQNINTTDNGTVSTTPAPTKYSVDTKQILTALALAENLEGTYPAGTTFPSGAKLVVVIANGSGTPPDFQVLDKTNHLLVDVSDIISAQTTGNFGSDVFSGKQNDTTGLANPTQTDLQIFSIFYDDTAVPGSKNIQLYLTGLMTNVTTDSVPNKTTGAFTETQSHKMTTSAGDGNYNGNPLVVTGSVTATGKAVFSP